MLQRGNGNFNRSFPRSGVGTLQTNRCIMNYILARLQEASTLRGIIIGIAGLIGYHLSDTDAVTLIAAGNILAGLIGAALPDQLTTPKTP